MSELTANKKMKTDIWEKHRAIAYFGVEAVE